MAEVWSNDQPIYRQLRDKVAANILRGGMQEGEFLPSVRQVSAEQQINHLTVAKAYQELVDEGILEMKRGRGMMVLQGARAKLLNAERKKFEQSELPALYERLKQLDMSISDLISTLNTLQQNEKGDL